MLTISLKLNFTKNPLWLKYLLQKKKLLIYLIKKFLSVCKQYYISTILFHQYEATNHITSTQ